LVAVAFAIKSKQTVALMVLNLLMVFGAKGVVYL
jgi:hypothetical protein